MAISSIGTNARDYSTVQAWEDAAAATLSDTWEGECYNDSEFSVAGNIVTFAGITASATNFIELRTAAGQGFKDHASASTNALGRYDQSLGVGLKCTGTYAHGVQIDISYVRLRYLQILHTAAANRYTLNITSNALSGVEIDGVICNKSASTSGAVVFARSGAFKRSIIVQRQSGGGHGLDLSAPGSSVSFDGCTVVRPSDITAGGNAINNAGGSTIPVTNTAMFGFSNDVDDDARFSGNNNASDQTIGFGSSNQSAVTYANQFENTTSASLDLRLKSGANCLDTGTGSALDILGQAVSNGTKDIGAHEKQVGGGGITGPLIGGGHLGKGGPLIGGRLAA